jgi:hypothetical protein
MWNTNSEYALLSRRAKNIISDIGFEQILNHYCRHGNLNSIRQVGFKTNQELIKYLDFQLKINTLTKNEEKIDAIKDYTENIDNLLIKNTLLHYSFRLSNRANKIFIKFLNDYSSEDLPKKLIQYPDINLFQKLPNCGIKTAHEIIKYIESIGDILIMNKKVHSEVSITIDKITFVDLEKVINNSFWFEQLKKKHQYLIKEVFLNDQNLSFEAIAKELNITRERVRQIVFNLENYGIPKFLESIDLKKNFTKSTFNGREKELPYFILDITKIREKHFITNRYNDRFIRIVYCYLLNVKPYCDFLIEKFPTATKKIAFPFIGDKKSLNYDQLIQHLSYISAVKKIEKKEQIDRSKIEVLFNSKFMIHNSELFDFQHLLSLSSLTNNV